VKVKVVIVLPGGELQEEERDVSGPYFNRNSHISNGPQKFKRDVFKK
jgi:hypothetical protein